MRTARKSKTRSNHALSKKVKTVKLGRANISFEDLVVDGWYSVTLPDFLDENVRYLCWIRRKSNSEIVYALFEIKNEKLEFVKKATRKRTHINSGSKPMRSLTAREQRMVTHFNRTMKE